MASHIGRRLHSQVFLRRGDTSIFVEDACSLSLVGQSLVRDKAACGALSDGLGKPALRFGATVKRDGITTTAKAD